MRRLLGIAAVCCLAFAGCSGDAEPSALPYVADGSYDWHGTVATTQPTTTLKPIVRTVTTRASRQRVASRRGRCGSLEDVKRMESGGNYQAQNRKSSASGAYQYLDSTWNGYGGYERAKDAPPDVQDQRAREDWAAGKQRQWVVC